VKLTTVTYDAPGWGVGEVVFRGDVPLHHTEPGEEVQAARAPETAVQAALVGLLTRYFAGERVTFADVDLEPTLAFIGVTPFEAACLRKLQQVPYGETISYAELARRGGRPRAHRAAGAVCARGTLSVVVPYHRVIRADGSIGTFGREGDALKRRLLALEGVV
jgi:methylated-DNA-[protein]-cysteine S-methyltransferase